ncbi:xylose isomerase [Zhengella mangrovi]|uniref:Xylose isomerase n=1 Tax=Zhengella mangrovi TaxID=1982044 RepID=A0A2G1QLL1_9HYPH|nr:sugar phosphate isomerase/epimerase [Zhengella mangrovi]PHP66340.1 xylose isomerase [Zhengella mangrovi]
MTISFQLYSARNFQPWDDVIATLSDLGYKNVEGFGGNYADARAFRDLLDRHGMAMPTGHFFPIGTFEDGIDATLATARTLGMERLFCPAPEDALRGPANAADWIALARRLEDAAKRVQDAGFRFGWHNHHWEFMTCATGETPMALILEHAPSIEWEADIAWIVRGGADPLDWIGRHGDRMTTAHVKDLAPQGECADEDGWADVGHGVLDWPAIMDALRGAGVDLFVAEHDNPNDLKRFAGRTLATLRDLGE